MIELIIVLLGFIVIAVTASIYFERRDFNNGKCRKCGSDLYRFDTDSSSARGYCCPKCRYTTWVSFADRKLRKEDQN